MGKIAFVFSGQGDQYPGMGKELAEKYAGAVKIFDMCDNIRPGTSAQCFCGSDEELKETKNTQPCLFALELATAAVLNEAGIKPDALAGFSLGEVVACTFGGIVDYETGFRLVCKRGELMQEVAEKHDTSMAAVLKLSAEKLIELCSRYDNIYPVNFNCPGQITVSGLAAEMPAFYDDIKAVGGRALPLKVKGAFHSPFMREAADAFAKVLLETELKPCGVRIYSNLTAEPYTEDIAYLLSQQISNPVRFENIIRNMIADGIDTFVEIGPGKTLTNMIGRIDSSVRAYSTSDLETVINEIKQ